MTWPRASFHGQTVLVTGAGSGIGATIARVFAERGAHTAVNDIDAAAAERVVRELTDAGLSAAPFVADVTLEPAVRVMCDGVVETFGSLDILVNNAGVLGLTPTEQLELDDWSRTLAVNLTAAFICCRTVMPGMRRQGRGRIINIASLAGESGGIAAGVDYAASKGGLLTLTRKLALEVAPYGITVNAIAPGTTRTPMIEAMPPAARDALQAKIPLGRLGEPEDVAFAVCFLASDEASFITGATLDVNGGLLMR
jgi:3-oxoacyl-[acyl-carrier protein] reductase